MGTIIQDFGPIYGEVVNGTVQGRPNGSVYVPISNTIAITLRSPGTATLSKGDNDALDISIAYDCVANAQDLASNMVVGVYSDSGCTVRFGVPASMSAGTFNIAAWTWVGGSNVAPTEGDTYYLRAELWNNGSMIAASSVIEVVGA